MMKETATAVSAPKEEKEEEEVSSVLSHGSPVGTARPSRSWRSSRTAAAARQRDSENSRASRSKASSLQLVCKSEPNADQLEYGTWHGRPGHGQGAGCGRHSGRVAGAGVVGAACHGCLLPPARPAPNVDGAVRQMSSLQRTHSET